MTVFMYCNKCKKTQCNDAPEFTRNRNTDIVHSCGSNDVYFLNTEMHKDWNWHGANACNTGKTIQKEAVA